MSNSGTYTTVTPAKVTWYDSGSLKLDIDMHSDLEASVFPYGNKTTKISYTWGNPEPTASVKELALLLLLAKVKIDDAIENQIKLKVERLKNKGVHYI